MSCFPRGMELTEIPGASSAVPLAGGGIVRWNLPLSVPRQSITGTAEHCNPCLAPLADRQGPSTLLSMGFWHLVGAHFVPLRKTPECFSVSSEGCILHSTRPGKPSIFLSFFMALKPLPKPTSALDRSSQQRYSCTFLFL